MVIEFGTAVYRSARVPVLQTLPYTKQRFDRLLWVIFYRRRESA